MLLTCFVVFALSLGIRDFRLLVLVGTTSVLIDSKTSVSRHTKLEAHGARRTRDREKRRMKRFRYRQKNKGRRRSRAKKFRRHRLPYHLVRRCRRRGGTRPPMLPLHGSKRTYSSFRRYRRRCLARHIVKTARERDAIDVYLARVYDLKPKCPRQPWDPRRNPNYIRPRLSQSYFYSHDPLGMFRRLTSLMDLAGLQGDTQGFLQRFPPRAACVRLSEMAQRVKEANIATRPTFRDMAVIWDTGASIGLTPFRADFIDYQPLEGVEVKDIARANAVLGVGTVMWKFHSRLGKEIFLPAVCYHVEHATIRLLSPQLYFKEHGGHATVEGHNVAFHLPEGSIVDIPVDPKTNLPAVRDAATTKKQQLEAGPHLMATPLQREMDLDYRVGIGGYVRHTPVSPANGAANMNSLCHPCVADETNQNLTSGQKELLQWHWKLAINMKHVQELMKPRAYKIGDETRYCRPVILTKFKDASTCQVPKCMSCELAAMKRRSTRVKTTKVVKG